MATFNETCAPTTRKYVTEESIVMPNWSRTFQFFWLHSYCLTLEKQPEKLNFQEFFTSKRLCGGYFQWNACNYFQNICNWTRYSDAKSIKKASNFFVTLFRFCFRKTNLKILIFRVFFTSKRPFGRLLSMKRVHLHQKNM